MGLSNTSSNYGSVTKAFHWLTALLIISTFTLGYLANEFSEQISSSNFDGSQVTIDRAVVLFSVHKTLGLTTFFVAAFRIVWAITQMKPSLLHPERKVEVLAAETVHLILYSSLILVPMTGWIHHAATVGYAPIYWPFAQNLPLIPKSESVAEVFAILHRLFVWVMCIALGFHIVGALKHHIIDQDSTLRRMLPGFESSNSLPEKRFSAIPAFLALGVWVVVIFAAVAVGNFKHSKTIGVASTKLIKVSSDWEVQTGTLAIAVTQVGSLITGEFLDWTASIKFKEPPSTGTAGSVDVMISINSLSLGSVSKQAMSQDFFNSSQFPTARFKAEIEKTAEGYQANGILTIRDRDVPVNLPFDLEINGNRAKMKGKVKLNRLDFNIGQSIKNEDTLAFAVDLNIELVARRND